MSDEKPKPKLRWSWVVVGFLAILLFVKWFVIDIYTVPQAGMYPTISSGGRVLGLRHPYRDPAQVQRGDVIIFSRQMPNGERYQFVWRVIGLPGDRVNVAEDSVSVNDQILVHEFVRTAGGLTIYREHNGNTVYEIACPAPGTSGAPAPDATLTVPPGEFFTLGDNRQSAQDSRYDGTVPFSQIIAKKL